MKRWRLLEKKKEDRYFATFTTESGQGSFVFKGRSFNINIDHLIEDIRVNFSFKPDTNINITAISKL